ncbi:nucleoside hydrolase [Terriglobus albidus]|uniref:nucleoside hydrolase n=1 Tax=Terriglobus albidus TaxID=1592106 RepID=UPI0021E0D1AA|nr:nucleoside hydrolase [Terriglobus albidus]
MRILKGAITSEKRTPVVFLHDAAIDEFISSMLLTVMPGIDLLGIIVINADCIADPAMHASSRLMQFMNRTGIPVALSRARGWNAFPWSYRRDCVSFNELPSLEPYKPHVPTPPPDGEALLAKLLHEAVEQHAPLTLLMTGPMTPLVDVLGKNPLLAAGIDRMIWMGGAIDVEGNLDPKTIGKVVANKHAEWNAFWDPYAVHDVFNSFGSIQMFPLDISNSAPVSDDFRNALQEQGKRYRYSQLAYEAYNLVKQEQFYRLWDVTATCWLTRPDLYTPATPMSLTIQQWGFEQGWIHKPLSPGTEKTQDVFFSFSNIQGFYQYVLELLATDGN